MKYEVFNTTIGAPNTFEYPELTKEQDKQIIATLFEQLLLFDSVTISTNRVNFGLTFLIDRLGLQTVERLIESGYIKLMIYSPVLVTGKGRKNEDGSMDESIIYGQPPIAAGSLSDKDLEPERNIYYALSNFNLSKAYIRNFTKKTIKNYIVPNGMQVSNNSEKLIIDAYLNNNLSTLGLPFEKEPNQLDLAQRDILLDLGHKIIETSILSEYNLKSYENYEHLEICRNNISNIGKAFNISNNTSEIFRIENVPNLQQLFINERLNFDSVFKIKHLSTAKYYKKWINNVGENSNCYEVTAAYLDEIKGKGKFIESTEGKFIKNLSSFVIGAGLGAAVGGMTGAMAGAAVLPSFADYGLGLLETFWLDNILKGKNPSMFVEDIKKKVSNE